MKKILVTSTDLMMLQFLVPHVLHLKDVGYDVEVVCSEVGGRFAEVETTLSGIKVRKVELYRSPLQPKNLKGLGELKKIINSSHYDLIWTNEPVMGVMTRLAATKARKKGTKVVYMAHGFHFYDGAPRLNWMIYYPIEKLMASRTDVIVTINKEDYARAGGFKCADVRYIHGIGINTDRLTKTKEEKYLRQELGIGEDSFVVLSVGELNDNKNQAVVLDALAKIKDPAIHYVLCGKGANMDTLKAKAATLGLSDNVHFLGYRKDVVDICSEADVFVMPSKREGLPVASLEAMYVGLPLITSRCRGIVDVMEDGVTGYIHSYDDSDGITESITHLRDNTELRVTMGEENKHRVIPYCLKETKEEVLKIIVDILGVIYAN